MIDYKIVRNKTLNSCDIIGVGAQSTLGGRTFLPENMYEKLTNKMPEFYMILPPNVRILHNNQCRIKVGATDAAALGPFLK